MVISKRKVEKMMEQRRIGTEFHGEPYRRVPPTASAKDEGRPWRGHSDIATLTGGGWFMTGWSLLPPIVDMGKVKLNLA